MVLATRLTRMTIANRHSVRPDEPRGIKPGQSIEVAIRCGAQHENVIGGTKRMVNPVGARLYLEGDLDKAKWGDNAIFYGEFTVQQIAAIKAWAQDKFVN